METTMEKLQNILSLLTPEELKELETTLDEVFTPARLQQKPKVSLKSSWAKGVEGDQGDYISIYLRITDK